MGELKLGEDALSHLQLGEKAETHKNSYPAWALVLKLPPALPISPLVSNQVLRFFYCSVSPSLFFVYFLRTVAKSDENVEGV